MMWDDTISPPHPSNLSVYDLEPDLSFQIVPQSQTFLNPQANFELSFGTIFLAPTKPLIFSYSEQKKVFKSLPLSFSPLGILNHCVTFECCQKKVLSPVAYKILLDRISFTRISQFFGEILANAIRAYALEHQGDGYDAPSRACQNCSFYW
jgi:hypothetical protein